ncbi:MAG: hypothetical protein JW882_06930 [Deltaproteobacteria bacterium]|nr:hypothetical protein [Deltaproteobacteria bacterium]
MEFNIPEIEDLYRMRISHFRDLLDCITRERDNLISMDINGIWSNMEEKQGILDSIEKTENIFAGTPDYRALSREIPPEELRSIIRLSRTLGKLREEIRVRVEENTSFIKETLGFFKDIISVFAMSCRSEGVYGPGTKKRKELFNMIYHSEV